MSKPKISKIVIEVGGKKLEFTTDEAKELKTLLADLFGGEKTNTVYIDRYRPYPHWNWPTYSRTTPVPTRVPEIYCGKAWSASYDAQASAVMLSAKN